ncbi:hypothetical protein MLD38_033481 [Melastoma candidum]|uniref:Uncharacterized protein n=1 Tax=Melastoma candidum TaxID=119954 RepID=A0ACB9M6Q0_9MYRT|nr:hypothetical protein MLD38_033481 [Melastoma candidum]
MPVVPELEVNQSGGMGKADVPKGCIAVSVGQGEEQRRRFVVPVGYVNHPLFGRLLQEAEEEYGFNQEGLINIPCHVEEFRSVQESIDRDNESHHHHHHHHHHRHHKCFWVV